MIFAGLARTYDRLVLAHPVGVLVAVALVVALFAIHARDFRLDASSDSLVIQDDPAWQYYREIRDRYGSDEFLIITYTPTRELFAPEVLEGLRQLRDALRSLPRVREVRSILDVPVFGADGSLGEATRTLDEGGTDPRVMRRALISSPLYRNVLISPDAGTTALIVHFEDPDGSGAHDPSYRRGTALERVREKLQAHRDGARIHLGGVPMIVADSIAFIRHDLIVFAPAVVAVLVVVLAVAFGALRWVCLPLATCAATVTVMFGLAGLLGWPVTVVSANFPALLLVITLSLTIHLVVRYRELAAKRDVAREADPRPLIRETMHSKAAPCFYTALTSMVAFGSLVVSGVRPVIDFGWLMTIGIGVGFALAFTLFPAVLALLAPAPPSARGGRIEAAAGGLGRIAASHPRAVGIGFGGLTVLAIAGLPSLSVENRFIDYYRESTAIYRGMELIDRELGGTTPLEVIVDAPVEAGAASVDPRAGFTATSYWFNTRRLEEVEAIHDFLDGLPETGKVLSLATAYRMLQRAEPSAASSDFLLAVAYKRLSDEVEKTLFAPYLSTDGDQLRFSVRVRESDPSLDRDALIRTIREQLVEEFELAPDQVHVTGMLLLYRNLLDTLAHSQLLTVGVVLGVVGAMFALSFRSYRVALVALVPNVIAASWVLGVMGWLELPLDVMTIGIGAVSLGIGVDDTIHYVHRYRLELGEERDYLGALRQAHASIGRAIFLTTLSIALGFATLALSSFVPTLYFGLLTGFAMVAALLADLTLLPVLLVATQPFGAPGRAPSTGRSG